MISDRAVTRLELTPAFSVARGVYDVVANVDVQKRNGGQNGKVAITSRDITTNLPYVPGAHLVFDHHESETVRNSGRRSENHIIEAHAPSAARVVYNHYGGKAAFPRIARGSVPHGCARMRAATSTRRRFRRRSGSFTPKNCSCAHVCASISIGLSSL